MMFVSDDNENSQATVEINQTEVRKAEGETSSLTAVDTVVQDAGPPTLHIGDPAILIISESIKKGMEVFATQQVEALKEGMHAMFTFFQKSVDGKELERGAGLQ